MGVVNRIARTYDGREDAKKLQEYPKRNQRFKETSLTQKGEAGGRHASARAASRSTRPCASQFGRFAHEPGLPRREMLHK